MIASTALVVACSLIAVGVFLGVIVLALGLARVAGRADDLAADAYEEEARKRVLSVVLADVGACVPGRHVLEEDRMTCECGGVAVTRDERDRVVVMVYKEVE